MLRASTPRPERPALDGLGEDHRRRALVLGRGLVRGVDLAVVVAAAAELARARRRSGARPACAAAGPGRRSARGCRRRPRPRTSGTRRRASSFILLDEHAVDVAGEQLVPLAAPDDLDDVPAGAAEQRLELLDDLAVAAHRAVEALQVAVDDEGQVVEPLARRERQRRRATRARPSRRRRGTPTPAVARRVARCSRLCR